MFRNPFSFEGRIRRTEYGLTLIIYSVLLIILNILITTRAAAYFFLFFAHIPLLWFAFAQGAKRCHDKSDSGWYQFIPFYFIWLIFANSDPGENCYGPNPKGIGNQDGTL